MPTPQSRRSLFALMAAGLMAGSAAQADVVAATEPLGSLYGIWSNNAIGQNFMVQFTLTSDTTLTGFEIVTGRNYASVGTNVSVKIRADSGSGAPGATNLFQFTDVIDTETALDAFSDRSAAHFDGVTLTAGTYWIGMAGVDADLTWSSFNNGQGQVPAGQALFTGDNYRSAPAIGSLAYRIEGTPANNVPEPASWALAAVALAGLSISRRRAAR